MKTQSLKIIRPDAKGRITLGILAKGVSGFTIVREDDKIILTPYAEIPAKERWLFENKEALKRVRQGLQDSACGKVRSLGSFQKHLKKERD